MLNRLKKEKKYMALRNEIKYCQRVSLTLILPLIKDKIEGHHYLAVAQLSFSLSVSIPTLSHI